MKLTRLMALALAASLTACADGSTTAEPDAARDAAVEHDARAAGEDASSAERDATVAIPADGGSSYVFPCLWTREPTGEATFEAIYIDIFCHRGCTNGYCHGGRGSWAGLDMSTIEGAYAALVDQSTGTLVPVDGRATCIDSDLLRVSPGDPEGSLLYQKVTGSAECGTPMPPPDSEQKVLTPDERDQVRAWIEAGAPLSEP